MDNVLENTKCIICSEQNGTPFLTVRDRLDSSSNSYNLIQCNCGFVYVNPRPSTDDIDEYYKSAYYDPHNVKTKGMWYKTYRFIQNLAMRWKYSIISKYYQSGKLLDIGGGNGDFAVYMNKKGWDVTLQDNYINLDKSYSHISHVSQLSDLPSQDKFELITLWHSLEHMHDITALFNYISNFLKKGGIMIIAVPNMLAPERKFYRNTWAAYDVPRHLYHFNLNRLTRLLNQNGYDIIQKYSIYQDMPYNILLSLPGYSPFHIIKALFVSIYSFIYTLLAGPKFASSIFIVCKKSI